MKRSSPILKLDDLEQRDVPSTVNINGEWFYARNLTMSFTPEKTLIDGVQSSKFGSFGGINLGTSSSQMAFLRAVQAYVTVTNINVGLVTDNGDPLGTSGEMQGDTRFGDIRVTSRPLDGNALATATPFNWAVGTWSGDIIVNNKTAFTIGDHPTRPDLYTVALHELGHVFDLVHSTDPESVMTERFTRAKSGLAASDISEVQSRFGGARRPDPFEGSSGNQSLNTATVLGNSGNRRIVADLSDQDRVDTYSFTVPGGADKARIQLQTSGLSLLTSRLQVLDSRGNILREESSIDPSKGNLEIRLNGLKGGEQFYIQVLANAETGFHVGRYQLSLEYRNEKPSVSTFERDSGDNDTLATASDLVANSLWSNQSTRERFVYNGTVENRTDVDYYRVSTPSNISASNSTLMIQLRIFNSKQVLPTLQVVDGNHNQITAHLVAYDGQSAVYQVNDISRFRDLFLVLKANGTNSSVNYRIVAEFTESVDSNLQVLQRGALNRESRTSSGTLEVNKPSFFRFTLNTTSEHQGQSGKLVMQIVNERRQVVASAVQVLGSGPASLTTYLLSGTYQIIFTWNPAKNSNANIVFWLDGGIFSDPIGPKATSVSTSPISTNGGTTTTSGTTGNTSSTGDTSSPPSLPPYMYDPALTLTLGALMPIYDF